MPRCGGGRRSSAGRTSAERVRGRAAPSRPALTPRGAGFFPAHVPGADIPDSRFFIVLVDGLEDILGSLRSRKLPVSSAAGPPLSAAFRESSLVLVFVRIARTEQIHGVARLTGVEEADDGGWTIRLHLLRLLELPISRVAGATVPLQRNNAVARILLSEAGSGQELGREPGLKAMTACYTSPELRLFSAFDLSRGTPSVEDLYSVAPGSEHIAAEQDEMARLDVGDMLGMINTGGVRAMPPMHRAPYCVLPPMHRAPPAPWALPGSAGR